MQLIWKYFYHHVIVYLLSFVVSTKDVNLFNFFNNESKITKNLQGCQTWQLFQDNRIFIFYV